MKREEDIYREFNRLRKYITDLEEAIASSYTGYGAKALYKEKIREAERDIKKLVWVLED